MDILGGQQEVEWLGHWICAFKANFNKTPSILPNSHTNMHSKPAACKYLFPLAVPNTLPIFKIYFQKEILFQLAFSPVAYNVEHLFICVIGHLYFI